MKPKPFLPEMLKENRPYYRDKNSGLTWHCCSQRVLYADTDRSQVVYHANYLRYFELGRASLMRDACYPYKEIEESGFIYPIIQVELNYFSPLYYDDPMRIFTRPSDLERVKLRFDYVISHEETGEIVCKGFTRHCATNRSGRPVGIDEKTLMLWKHFPE
ncbi:MAG: acyl-CoA thioesterase [Desulfococcaceae bacterium]|jgi:acyl-CoA thioester hydrolase|nr:acyl-CoA thioesterase [Desulfococcaceae bacterium]